MFSFNTLTILSLALTASAAAIHQRQPSSSSCCFEIEINSGVENATGLLGQLWDGTHSLPALPPDRES